MNPPNQLRASTIEKDAFWRKHYEQQQSSGLSRIIYCRQHDLNYNNFGYWINKQSQSCENKLISVRLKTEPVIAPQKTLCTLELKGGHSLKIHDADTLSLILERYA